MSAGEGPPSDPGLGRGLAGRSYAFGETPTAAARLVLLARTFEEPSRSFVRAALEEVRPSVELAADLGCGPGLTTQLLVSVAAPTRAAGLDTSAAFLEQARTLGVPGTSWHHHDVTEAPFPTGPVDLVYARYLLAHLARPESVLGTWLSQLRPGGLLLVEEDEWIAAPSPALARYLELAASLVAHHGGDLYLGRRLGGSAGLGRYRPVFGRLYRHRVPVPVAARLFAMNFATWRHDPFVTEGHAADTLEHLADELERLAASEDDGVVIFALRQVGYPKQAPPRPDRPWVGPD